MYGVESGSTGLGGLAAQAPGGDQFLGRALGIAPKVVPIMGAQGQPAGQLYGPAVGTIASAPVVSPSGTAVEQPVSTMLPGWRQALDWHNSPAPWILLLILVLYGWLHLSVKASAGRRASASAVL